MSSSINAGCIVTTDFVTAGSKLFTGYIDYIDRETAVRSENLSKYSLYTDYMDNPEKATELFTSYSNRLSYEEKQQLKSLYEKAQWNGSPMWQTVISFDNLWLEKNGLYNSEEGFLDVKALHEYTRKAVNAMLKKEGLETATWSAAIHYNTDNLHIHIATVEPIPTRPLVTVKTVQFSAQWIKDNNIIQDEKVPFNNMLCILSAKYILRTAVFRILKKLYDTLQKLQSRAILLLHTLWVRYILMTVLLKLMKK